jgi:glycosyltransferase involved in cell wall biosynthesis
MKKRSIVLDLYDIRSPFVGIGEVCLQLGKHLALRAKELQQHDITFYFIVPQDKIGCFGDNVRYIPIENDKKGSIRFVRFYPKRFSIFHATHQYTSIKYMFFAKRQIMTIHDINFMYETEGIKQKKEIVHLQKNINRMNVLSYISEFTKQDVHRVYKIDKKEAIIYNGVSDLRDLVNTAFYDQKDYLLHISSMAPKKNAHLLVEMMKYLPSEKLILVGNWETEYAQDLKSKIKKEQINNIEILNPVDTKMKALLYKNCKAFLFPSLCEGFGLPPIEAMYFGKPVFLSQLTSLPEIGADVAFYWSELIPHKMAETVQEKLSGTINATDSVILQKRASQFNWMKCADDYINLYLNIIKD